MKERVLNIDYFDLVVSSSIHYDENHIERLFVRCAQAGITTVLWRLSVCGRVAYRSSVKPHYTGKYSRTPGAYRMAEILRRFDPFEVACRLARKHGLKIFGWITLFDEDAGPDLVSDFVLEHPEYTWRSRDRKRYLRGALCYAYPEVVEYRRNQLEEVLAYSPDGLYLCTRSHAKFAEVSRDLDDFGFNEPIVQTYHDRYGVDILTEDFDKLLWYQIQGESFTAFLRTARDLSSIRGVAMWVGIHSDCYSLMNISPMGHMHLNWEDWAKENLVDALIVGAGEAVLDQHEMWFRNVGKRFTSREGNGPDILLWFRLFDWRNDRPFYADPIFDTKNPALIRDVARKYQGDFDGYAFHEAGNVEKFDLWQSIGG